MDTKPKNVLDILKQKDREVRRRLIMDAAERVFAMKPFDKASLNEIAREAGVAKSSIYTYFPNQEALFVEIAVRDSNILVSELRRIIDESSEPWDEQVIDSFIDFFINHDSFFRMTSLFMTQGALGDKSVVKANHIGRQIMDVFDSVFRKMNYSGNVRLLSHSFFAALSGILISYRKYPGRSEEEIHKHMKRIGKLFKEMFVCFIEHNRLK